jgi:hypothetical protein
MIGPLSVLGVWSAVIPVQATMGWLLNSTGNAGALAVLTAILLVATTPALVVAAGFSATAVSFVILGQALAAIPLSAWIAHRRLGLRLLHHMGAIAPIGVAAALAWVVARLLADLTTEIDPAASLILSVLPAAGTYVATIALIDRETFQLAMRTAGRLLARGDAEVAPEIVHGSTKF